MLTYSPLEWVRDATVSLPSVLILALFFQEHSVLSGPLSFPRTYRPR